MRGRADDDAARNAERAGRDHAVARVAHDGACGNQNRITAHRPADAKWPGMFRIKRPAGSLSVMINLTGEKNALLDWWEPSSSGSITSVRPT